MAEPTFQPTFMYFLVIHDYDWKIRCTGRWINSKALAMLCKYEWPEFRFPRIHINLDADAFCLKSQGSTSWWEVETRQSLEALRPAWSMQWCTRNLLSNKVEGGDLHTLWDTCTHTLLLTKTKTWRMAFVFSLSLSPSHYVVQIVLSFVCSKTGVELQSLLFLLFACSDYRHALLCSAGMMMMIIIITTIIGRVGYWTHGLSYVSIQKIISLLNSFFGV